MLSWEDLWRVAWALAVRRTEIKDASVGSRQAGESIFLMHNIRDISMNVSQLAWEEKWKSWLEPALGPIWIGEAVFQRNGKNYA